MGGEKEATIPNTPAKKSVAGTTTVGTLRVHENKGEIHFHDDASKLKVAVPVAVWYEAWQKLTRGTYPSKWSYVDVKNNTSLKVRLKVKDGKLDCKATVGSVQVTPEFQALNQYTG